MLDTSLLKGLALIEQFWHLNGRFPSEPEIHLALPDFSLPDALDNKTFQLALTNRGISVPSVENLWRPSELQIAAIVTITNYADPRPRTSKLDGLGINLNTWAGWLKDRNFKNALEKISRDNFEAAASIAREGLAKAMERGEVSAIKYFNDLTGEAPQVQNLQMMLTKLVEVIQLHVRSPEVLHAIDRDFRLIMAGRDIDRVLIEAQL